MEQPVVFRLLPRLYNFFNRFYLLEQLYVYRKIEPIVQRILTSLLSPHTQRFLLLTYTSVVHSVLDRTGEQVLIQY